jgi:hypothetical protein
MQYAETRDADLFFCNTCGADLNQLGLAEQYYWIRTEQFPWRLTYYCSKMCLFEEVVEKREKKCVPEIEAKIKQR